MSSDDKRPKLKWTRESAINCDGETTPEHEHWFAQLGEEFVWMNHQHSVRLRYCTHFHDLWLINEADATFGISFFELELAVVKVNEDLELALRLGVCERVCREYLQKVFSKVLGDR